LVKLSLVRLSLFRSRWVRLSWVKLSSVRLSWVRLGKDGLDNIIRVPILLHISNSFFVKFKINHTITQPGTILLKYLFFKF
jgi:hypothetical protein